MIFFHLIFYVHDKFIQDHKQSGDMISRLPFDLISSILQQGGDNACLRVCKSCTDLIRGAVMVAMLVRHHDNDVGRVSSITMKKLHGRKYNFFDEIGNICMIQI